MSSNNIESNSPPASSKDPERSTSLFGNVSSRGPLYQYWRERNRESAEVRDRRVLDAKERARGMQPVNPEPGPSSNAEMRRRLEAGRNVPPTVVYSERPPEEAMGLSQDLPQYEEVAGRQLQDSGGFERSASEEKEKSDRYLTQEADGSDSHLPSESRQESVPEKNRKKSIGRSIGGWVGTAFTGYNMKSDGKGNANRW